mmetsp:Transcript_13659/g.34345  ORF Transcript_13659/g.34345 Transcript_13659/m.34345 type:complete len:254 (+) Transcript_13659:1503-2264(+)
MVPARAVDDDPVGGRRDGAEDDCDAEARGDAPPRVVRGLHGQRAREVPAVAQVGGGRGRGHRAPGQRLPQDGRRRQRGGGAAQQDEGQRDAGQERGGRGGDGADAPDGQRKEPHLWGGQSRQHHAVEQGRRLRHGALAPLGRREAAGDAPQPHLPRQVQGRGGGRHEGGRLAGGLPRDLQPAYGDDGDADGARLHQRARQRERAVQLGGHLRGGGARGHRRDAGQGVWHQAAEDGGASRGGHAQGGGPAAQRV